MSNPNMSADLVALLGKLQAPTTETAAPAPARKTAKIWANIGVPSVNDDGEPTFISGAGVPLDVLTKKPAGSNKTRQKANALFDHLLEIGMSLEPGQSVVVEGLSVEIRAVAEADGTEGLQDGSFLDVLGGIKVKAVG